MIRQGSVGAVRTSCLVGRTLPCKCCGVGGPIRREVHAPGRPLSLASTSYRRSPAAPIPACLLATFAVSEDAAIAATSQPSKNDKAYL